MNLLLIDPSESVSNLVLSHSACAEVLRRHRIDYCCDGDISVQQAANRRGVGFETLAQELLSVICDRGAQEMQDPRELSTTDLIAHIIRNHHQYVRRALPEITFLASKVGLVHGGLDPRLQDFSQTCSELASLPRTRHERCSSSVVWLVTGVRATATARRASHWIRSRARSPIPPFRNRSPTNTWQRCSWKEGRPSA